MVSPISGREMQYTFCGWLCYMGVHLKSTTDADKRATHAEEGSPSREP
jgi:hypothetical protein